MSHPSSSREAPASVVAATQTDSSAASSSRSTHSAVPTAADGAATATTEPAQQQPDTSLQRTLELLEARLTEGPRTNGELFSSPPVSNDATHSSASSLTSTSRGTAGLSNLSTGSATGQQQQTDHVPQALASDEVPTQYEDDEEEEDSNQTKRIQNHRTEAGPTTVRENSPASSQLQPTATTSNPSQQQQQQNPQPQHSASKDKRKRKSVPVKVEVPSVKENNPKETMTVTTNTAQSNHRPRKRTRSPLGDVATKSRGATTTTSPLLKDPPHHSNHSRSNPSFRAAAVATVTTTRSSKTHPLAPPKNNKRILDFFPRIGGGDTTIAAAVSKKSAASTSLKSPSSTAGSVPPSKPAATAPTGTTSSTPGKMPFSSPPTASVSAADDSSALERLRQRCLELERTCQDKDEQLRAVANNRSILHSSLQSALQQRQDEISQLQRQKQLLENKTAAVLEELARNEATREGLELRERLAADGARLGRLVYSRAGLRSVETWQEGHASKRLSQRRARLKAQRLALERRQSAAKKALKEVQSRMETETADKQRQQQLEKAEGISNSKEQEEGSAVVGGIPIVTKLDAMEAVESVRFHLATVRTAEKELAVEEQTLHDEKTAHIRALKRVASEDSSRFRSRPKLHDRYVLKSLLGKGGFSEVWQAYDLVELREVAVKIHQLDPRWPDAKKENYTKHVSREYEIHRNVRHPRIVSLFDVFEIDNNSFATVLELCNGTDLDSLLKQKKRLSERDGRAILLQILLGMQYLSYPSEDGSRQGIIHYDLKPGNILFDVHGDTKITDFGLSKILDAPDPAVESMELTSQGAGTYWYLPPECFIEDDSIRISNKVDVWSIGVIFYQMLYGRRPFGDGQSQDKILKDRTMLNAHQVTFPDKPNVSEEGKEFIRSCLTYDQTFRPTIAQLCQNSYVLSKQL